LFAEPEENKNISYFMANIIEVK